MIHLFDIESYNTKPYRSYSGFKGNVTAIGFEASALWLFAASEDGSLKIFDLFGKGFMRSIENKVPINTAELHPA